MRAYYLCTTGVGTEFAEYVWKNLILGNVSGDEIINQILDYCLITEDDINSSNVYPENVDVGVIVYDNDKYILADNCEGSYDIYIKKDFLTTINHKHLVIYKIYCSFIA